MLIGKSFTSILNGNVNGITVLGEAQRDGSPALYGLLRIDDDVGKKLVKLPVITGNDRVRNLVVLDDFNRF